MMLLVNWLKKDLEAHTFFWIWFGILIALGILNHLKWLSNINFVLRLLQMQNMWSLPKCLMPRRLLQIQFLG